MPVLLLLHLVAMLILPRLWEARRWTQWREATCRGCGYDLQGLGQDAACPECGVADPRERSGPSPRTYEWNGARGAYLGIMLVAWLIAPTLLAAAIEWTLGMAIHLREGFALSSARRWVSLQLFPGNPWESPAIAILICTPWVLSLWGTRLATGRRRYAVGLGLVLATWVVLLSLAYFGV